MAGLQLSIKVRSGLVRQGLQNLESETPKIGRRLTRTVMERIKRRMQEYPPEPAGQSEEFFHPILGRAFRPVRGRYRRTGLLGASWAIEDTDDKKGYRISNTAARKGRTYAAYVVGNAYGLRQAWMHKGRWQLFRNVVEDEVEKMPEQARREILMVARRSGLKTGGEA